MNGTLVPNLGHLTIVRTYDALNEPMLFSAQNEVGHLYFVSYANVTEYGEEWMVTAVSKTRLHAFERGEIDIRDMFLAAETSGVTFVAYDDRDNYAPTIRHISSTDAALLEYMPLEGIKNPRPSNTLPSSLFEMGYVRQEAFVLNVRSSIGEVTQSGFSITHLAETEASASDWAPNLTLARTGKAANA